MILQGRHTPAIADFRTLATDTCGKKGFGCHQLTGYFRVVDGDHLRGRSVESRRTHLYGSRGA